VAPTYAVDPGLDYSQPIQVPPPAQLNVSYQNQNYIEPPATTDQTQLSAPQQAVTPPEAATAADEVPSEATQNFDAARAAFKAQDYAKALADIDVAIKALNNDATMHEFRALVLFAQKNYNDAAAGIYAVLSVGPGWNWETMSSLYGNVETYTTQLRALEAFQRANPDAPTGHFLLAYHYLVVGHTPEALAQLERFCKLVPTDKLAPELIKAFTPAPSGKPKAQAQ
jgi:tetratricopeptide (TPR) repeat protein